MDELKPCPFCGGEADYYLGDGGYVQCSHCLATIPYRYELPYGEGKKQAITAWNRRPAPENKPLKLEQLRQMDGEPVWIEHFDSPCSTKTPGEWLILKSCNPTREHPYVDFKDKALCALYYGQGWLAYAKKPEVE